MFPPAADQRVQLRVRWRSLPTEQSAADLSDGTLRFLLLLAILANPDPPALIAFDEPETGLHPSMLPIIAEHAAHAAERTQVIFTAHSPQLLDAFNSTPPKVTDGANLFAKLDPGVAPGKCPWLKQLLDDMLSLVRNAEPRGTRLA